MDEKMKIKFWGTCGSLPAGLTGEEVEAKVANAVFKRDRRGGGKFTDFAEARAWVKDNLSFIERSTYGGDTTCCEVRCGDVIIVLDMGSGLRRFGNAIMLEIFKRKGLDIKFLMSHVHWDHIQGFPFFAPVFLPSSLVKNFFNFYGGVGWQGDLEEVLHGQMNPPRFPINFKQIEEEGPKMNFQEIYDGFKTSFYNTAKTDKVWVSCRRLNHPNECYGWRIEFGGKIFVFATDTEPYRGPHEALIQLAQNADVLYLDCQFSWNQYIGEKDNVSRQGWGHGYDKWCAEIANQARVKRLYIGHHDPGHPDKEISYIESEVAKEIEIPVMAAYDGLEIEI